MLKQSLTTVLSTINNNQHITMSLLQRQAGDFLLLFCAEHRLVNMYVSVLYTVETEKVNFKKSFFSIGQYL